MVTVRVYVSLTVPSRCGENVVAQPDVVGGGSRLAPDKPASVGNRVWRVAARISFTVNRRALGYSFRHHPLGGIHHG